jgi:hypothetical protein
MFRDVVPQEHGQYDQAKLVHRYLPCEVGELLVWYLWMVLPFWQHMQGWSRGRTRLCWRRAGKRREIAAVV